MWEGTQLTYLDSQLAADDEIDCVEDRQVQTASSGELHRDFSRWYTLYCHLLRDIFNLLAPEQRHQNVITQSTTSEVTRTRRCSHTC